MSGQAVGSQQSAAAATAGTLDQFVNNATLRPNQPVRLMVDSMRKSDDLLFSNLSQLDQLLTMLNSNDNSVAITQVLWVKLSSVPVDGSWANSVQPLILQTINFLKSFNVAHISQALDLFSRMCKSFVQVLVSRQKPLMGILPLLSSINQLKSEGELLSIMSSLLYLCVMAKCFKPALNLLSEDVVEIRKENNKFDIVDCLLYYYYGGVIYLALKDYKRAHLFFEITISMPASAISRIMVEAYKKYALVSFILDGRVCELPQKISNPFTRSVKSATQAYSEICSSKTTDELEPIRLKYEALLEEDKNMGLVKQCVKSQYKRNIQKLTKTFLTLSLTDITQCVKLPDTDTTEQYLLEMIEEGGAICARIDHGEGMVYFLDSGYAGGGGGGAPLLQRISNQVERCTSINRKIQSLDDSIKTSTAYVKKISASAEDEGIWKQGNT